MAQMSAASTAGSASTWRRSVSILQSLADRLYRDDRYFHGGARLEHRECRAAAYRRQHVCYRRPGYLGADLIPGLQRHHSSSRRVAVGGDGTQALLHDLRGALHDQFISLRNRSLAWDAHRVSRPAGSWRRRTCSPASRPFWPTPFHLQRLGMAFAIYGMAVVLAPSIGPTLGGWITDNYSWRWIFYINVPIGIISLLLTNHFVKDPDYITDQIARQKRSRVGLHVDYVGIGLITLGIGCMQVVLDKGQEDDWFASLFITALTVISITSLVALVIWELRQRKPVIELRLLKNSNFAAASLMMFVLGVVALRDHRAVAAVPTRPGRIHRRVSRSGAVARRSSTDSDDADCRTTVVARAGALARCRWVLDHRTRAASHDPAGFAGQFQHLCARLHLPAFGRCLHVHPDQHAGLSRRATRKEQSGLKHGQHVPQHWRQRGHLDGGDADATARANPSGHLQHAYRACSIPPIATGSQG